jgi:alkylation response protein AidB-like acyl-CoA dehydrogenase
MRAEWLAVTAALLAGMADAVLELGVDHARNRMAFGAPIGSFQGVSHPLAECAVLVTAARRLAQKASWFLDNEPASQPWLPGMAYVAAARAAERCAQTALHVQGGLGFTVESDVQLYLRRIKTLILLTGDPRRELHAIADHRYGTAEGGD